MRIRSRVSRLLPATTTAAVILLAATVSGQQSAPTGQGGGTGRQRQDVAMKPERARLLYVSDDPADHTRTDFEADIADKRAGDERYAKASQGVMDFQKITYRSSVGDMDIPAYLFQPLKKRGPKGHAAMVWVHGGVHGNWGINMFPFVKDAVERGYVVICPEYRGSTGTARRSTWRSITAATR